jgi:hypothetical protein
MTALWISGGTRSGKSNALIEQFCGWMSSLIDLNQKPIADTYPGVLVLAAIGDNRLDLSDRLTAATDSRVPFRSTTPLGFFEREVMLFWSLLVQKLDLAPQFPVRLRPENEQELATMVWRPHVDGAIGRTGIREGKLVRRLLDLYQLAAFATIDLDEIPELLRSGLGEDSVELPLSRSDEAGWEPEFVAELLQFWRSWCLSRGLLNYGIITELYAQHLLPDPMYRKSLCDRVRAVFADDVDEYPPVMRSVFEILLKGGCDVVCTFNPQGGIRLGLGADPEVMRSFYESQPFDTIALPDVPTHCSAEALEPVLRLVQEPMFLPPALPDCIQTLQTSTRAQLLRATANAIAAGITSGQVQAKDIAIVAPGMDPISRYALTQMLTAKGIRVNHLNEQRNLTAVPLIRSLLTLLTLIYPHLGRLVNRDAVAEMLSVLGSMSVLKIDPVRSGLLADHCFEPHPDFPKLLPSDVFPRWDRLGYQATQAYGTIVDWINTQKEQLEQRMIPSPIAVLDRAIQTFLLGGAALSSEQIASLRELLDMTAHYWDVDRRLRYYDRRSLPQSATVRSLILLLRSGAVTANPYPIKPVGPKADAVTIATVFQYRLERGHHRWQFWFDAGSRRWLDGVDALFASPLFLSSWSGRLWTPEDTLRMNEQRLARILQDLLLRSDDRVFLCFSDLATNGQEQMGSLIPVVNSATPL